MQCGEESPLDAEVAIDRRQQGTIALVVHEAAETMRSPLQDGLAKPKTTVLSTSSALWPGWERSSRGQPALRNVSSSRRRV